MANQILLYSREGVTPPPHFVRIVNPNFDLVAPTVGWLNPSGEWSWTGGSGYASYSDGGDHHSIYQYFQNPPLPGRYYDVSFTVSNCSQGAVRVYMGNDAIGDFTNGNHVVLYNTSSGATIAGTIAFVPRDSGGYFNGRITAVGVVENEAFRELSTDYRNEPYAMLDLYDDERIGISYRVLDTQSLTKRFGAVSKSFRIPATANNSIALGYPETNATPTVFDPAYKSKSVFLANDNNVLDGSFILSDVTTRAGVSEYTVEIEDSAAGISDAIKGKKLSDLDLSKWGHRLTLSDVVATWTTGRTWSHGYFYPLYPCYGVDYSINSHFVPALYWRAILHEVFQQNGFAYSLSPDIDALSNSLLYCPIGKKPNARTEDMLRSKVRASSDANQYWVSPSEQNYSAAEIWGNYIFQRWNNTVEEDPSGLWTDGVYTAPYTGKFTLDLHILGSVSIDTGIYPTSAAIQGDTHCVFALVDAEDGTVLGRSTAYYVLPDMTSAVSENYDFSNSITLDLLAGQKVTVEGRIYNDTILHHDTLSGNHVRPGITLMVDHTQSYIELQPTPGAYQVTEGMPVHLADWLGSASQEAFLGDLVRAFNASFHVDKDNSQLIHIKTRKHVYSTEDWFDRSGLIDFDADIQKQRLSVVSDSAYHFSFKEAKDEYNQRYKVVAGADYGEHLHRFNTDIFNSTNEVQLQLISPAPLIRDNAGRWLSGVNSQQDEATVKLLLKSTGATPTSLPIRYYNEQTQSAETYTHGEYYPVLHTDGIGSASTIDLSFSTPTHALTNIAVGLSSNNLFSNYVDQLELYGNSWLYTVSMRLTNAQVKEHINNVGARIWTELGWSILWAIIDHDPTLDGQNFCRVQLLECGPSEKNIRTNHISNASNASSAVNPVVEGTITGTGVLTGSGSVPGTNVFNTNNGNNQVGGVYNNTSGSGNTISTQTYGNTIRGFNNTIDAGVTGSTVFTNNTHVTESGSFYSTHFTSLNSATTFYNTVSIGPVSTNFYSSVTINQSGITIGGSSGLSFSSTGVTLNGETYDFTDTNIVAGTNITTGGTPDRVIVSVIPSPVFSSITATTIFSGSVDLSRYLTGGTGTGSSTRIIPGTNILTGGSSSAVTVSTTLSPSFFSITPTAGAFRSGDASNTFGDTGSTQWSSIFGGFLNTINGPAIASTIVGGSINTLSMGFADQTSGIFSSLSSQLLSASTSVILGGASNTLKGASSAAIVGGENHLMNVGSNGLSFIGGGNNHVLSAGTSSSVANSAILGGSNNKLINSAWAGMIGGFNNTLIGAPGSVVLAHSGITGTRPFTLYASAVDVSLLDLVVLTGSTPTAREGRMYYSGGTGLMICTGSTSSDWKRVSLL